MQNCCGSTTATALQSLQSGKTPADAASYRAADRGSHPGCCAKRCGWQPRSGHLGRIPCAARAGCMHGAGVLAHHACRRCRGDMFDDDPLFDHGGPDSALDDVCSRCGKRHRGYPCAAVARPDSTCRNIGISSAILWHRPECALVDAIFAAVQEQFTSVLHKTFAANYCFQWHNTGSNIRPFLSHSRIRKSV